MFMGVALLGLLAGSLASFFGLQSEESETKQGAETEQKAPDDPVLAELAGLRAEVKELAGLREQLAVLTRQLAAGDKPPPDPGAE
jgi:voltage-gated potassium channel